ncbi:hypothetical protein M422DRAFT_156186 [Sphaerobolus stellatus SS14]|nr:hypothetical protein M422DRAFT_156186 [Sphaerobolus stellatus SS14]
MTSTLGRRLPTRRLPVLPLRQTLDKYLKSIEPFLKEDEAKGGPKAEYELARRVRWAKEFEEGIGRVLQERLIELDKNSPRNWLDDNFWEKWAYLSSRAPLIVNSNWWCMYQDDPTIPEFDTVQGEYTFWQVRRAAWLLRRVLEYREQLEKKAVSSPSGKSTPYQIPFHQTRIPQPNCDVLAPLPSRTDHGSKRIILMLRDYIYALEVVDADEAPLPVAKLEEVIWAAIKDVENIRKEGEKAIPVGVLTAGDRDIWAKARSHLLELSPQNASNLKTIESAIMVLSLDDYTHPPSSASKSSPIKDVQLDAHLLNCSSGMHGHNRWFDKCVSYMIESNGRSGGMGEHSPCDGLVVGHLLFESLGENINPDAFSSTPSSPSPRTSSSSAPINSSTMPESTLFVQRLDWVADKQIKAWCVTAENTAKAISEDSDASMLVFREFGREWIKDVAKLSPDAFAQMAFQLAYFRDQGCFTATYETATTHMFIRGRTEVVRSFSNESREFVRAMIDPSCSLATRKRLLLSAIQAHNSYTRDAIRARGIDRHLLGLRLLMKEGEKATLFEDPLFGRSETWRLSTSGLYNGERFAGTGFGSPYPDGYGIQYLLNSDNMRFGIDSKHPCPKTSTEGLKAALLESLREMRALCQEDLNMDTGARL